MDRIRTHTELPTAEVLSYNQFQTCDRWARPEAGTELFESISEHGIRLPLVVVTNGKAAWQIDGSHRLSAAIRLGLETVPVCVLLDTGNFCDFPIGQGLKTWLQSLVGSSG